MLELLGEIGIEAIMIAATVGAAGCLIYLVVLTVLERRELRRMQTATRDAWSSRAPGAEPPHEATAAGESARGRRAPVTRRIGHQA